MYKQLFSIILIGFLLLIGGCTSGVALSPPVQIEKDKYKSSASMGTFLPRTPGREQGKELIKEADQFCQSMLKNFALDKIDIKRSRDKRISQIDLYFNCVPTHASERLSDEKSAEKSIEYLEAEYMQGEYLPDTSLLRE